MKIGTLAPESGATSTNTSNSMLPSAAVTNWSQAHPAGALPEGQVLGSEDGLR